MLRIRGEHRADWEWDARVRIPAITELLKVEDAWYRVINVLWRYQFGDDGVAGFDVGLIVIKTNPPNEEGWVPK